MLTCEQKKELHGIADKLKSAQVRERKTLLESAADLLGFSVKSVRRYLAQETGWKPERKTRRDKGISSVSQDYAMLVAGIQQTGKRATGKVLNSVNSVQDILAGNGILPVDAKTGETKAVSASTVRRAMKNYHLDNSVLKKSTPAVAQKSLHPNHVWELDASVCVLFYLPNGKVKSVDDKEAYKNKPENLEKIGRDKVIRYVITDHYSGFIFVRYSTGAEDAKGVLDTLIEAISKRSEYDPMHGVPEILVMDKGAGNKSGMIHAFCENLGIQTVFHKTGNPRAEGQVENAQNLVEKNFEGRLRFSNITTLQELQTACDKWRIHFNAREILRRASKTRASLWTSISQEHLKICEKDVLREIACWQAVTRKIDGNFEISVATKKFGKQTYDVSALSLYGISNGYEVNVFLNPFTAPDITVKFQQPDGSLVQMDFSPLVFDEAGFRADAPVIGEAFDAHKKTEAENALEKIEKLAFDAQTSKEAEIKKQKGDRPFQNIDFMADIKKSPAYLHAAGKPVLEREPQRLSQTQTAMAIKDRLPELWMKNPRKAMEWLKGKGSSFDETMLDELVAEFKETFEIKSNIINFREVSKCAG